METETVALAFDIFTNDDVESTANPIILMHGFLWNKFMLKELGYKLCKETKRTVFSLDLRNHGESPFSKHCDIELMVEDVKRFIRDHGLKKVVFISHSFSSTIAYLTALAEQECFFRKLAYDLDKVGNEFKWKIDIQFLQDKYLAGAFTAKPKGSLDHEILIIRCKDSGKISDSKFRDVILHNPNARLETIEDTTHLLMFEKEDIFLQLVKEFLR